MKVARAIATPVIPLMGGRFSPRALFSSGEQGAWYDPSDFLPNWRLNLLTYSEDFSNGVWNPRVGNATRTVNTLTPTTSNGGHYVGVQGVATTAGAQYVWSCSFKPNGYNYVSLYFYDTTTGNATSKSFRIDTGTIVSQVEPDAGITSTATISGPDVDGYYRCAITTAAVPGGSAIFDIRLYNNVPAASYAGDGVSGVYATKADLRLTSNASVAPTYQKITDGVQDYLTYQPQPVMFQDSAGTTPVSAVEQPVGLLLDKSKGLALGAELVTNGDFSSGTGWTLFTGATISGGKLNVSAVSGYVAYRNASGVQAGGYYEVTFTVSGYVSGSIRPYLGATPTFGTTVSANGTYTQRFGPISGGEVGFNSASAFTGAIDDVSVKAISGNHASQSTAASRPVLSARVNLLTYSEQFDNAAWTIGGIRAFGSGSVANTTATTDPLGGNAADLLVENNDSAAHFVYREFSTAIKNFTFSVYAKAKERSVLVMTLQDGSGNPPPYAVFNLATETYTVNSGSVPSSSGATASITSVGNEWYRCKLTANNYSSGVVYPIICLSNSATPTLNTYSRPEYTGDGTSGIYIWGADLRVTNVGVGLPAYQRVGAAVTATTNPAVTGVPDYDTSGFPLYLKFDGTDDSLATGSIDFTATDKMSVFAGVRKLSDTAAGVIAELSNDAGANNGAFNILASTSIGDGSRRTWGGQLRGTANNSFGGPTYASPISGVITQKLDIAGAAAANEIIQLVNGSATTLTFLSADSGTGSFGNYPLYVGRRNNASVPFFGHLYSLIVRGAQSTDAQIASTETYVNNLTKAY